MTDNRYLLRFFTLDPLHIGVGQDIMGEVDLPIDRESETNVPRIPGTALKGGFRAHASWKLKMDGNKDKPCPGDQPAEQEGDATKPHGPRSREQYCGITTCPICQTFGYPSVKLKNEDKAIPGHEGRVYFRDARLAFFPAATSKGTVWFSTPGRAAAWLDSEQQEYPELLVSRTDHLALSINEKITGGELLIGWIHLTGLTSSTEDKGIQQVIDALRNATHLTFPETEYWQHIVNRTVLLDETNFYRVVETCLERRTCNRVDQDTGTVSDGALFSYEALPRASLLYSRIYIEKHFSGKINKSTSSPLDVCSLACEGFARMGIGGMQTRGLGSLLVEPFTSSSEENGHG
ncbi:MAG: RAMP superfamily CRISPR-associated protein [Candidatus Electrothrix aestuarii]|uniref:RAMP superfamily CRISPR-associated protein n=1 Tax=Candidatus Electrothrix aestuarii TaxID=3062594 RepID=A0AAU8LQ56_9BACT|nr:RAMP superfamily CRISPR-associated protein [Candidatus Electrothrix aestuarii]